MPSSNGHPKYHELVIEAVRKTKERKGTSRQRILKYILENYDVSANSKVVNSHLRKAILDCIEEGSLKHVDTNGSGCVGRFKLSDANVKEPTSKPARKPAKAKPVAPPPSPPGTPPPTKVKKSGTGKAASAEKHSAKKASPSPGGSKRSLSDTRATGNVKKVVSTKAAPHGGKSPTSKAPKNTKKATEAGAKKAAAKKGSKK